MIRGKLSYMFWLAISLWAAIFASLKVSGIVILLFGLAAAAAAFPLLYVHLPAWRQTGLALLFLAAGIVLGILRFPAAVSLTSVSGSGVPSGLVGVLNGMGAYTAFSPDRVAGFSGVLSADSTVTPGSSRGATRYQVRLEQVWTAGGELRGQARGSALLWVRDGPPLLMGREITVEAKLAASEEPSPFAYLSWADAAEVQGGGYRRPLFRLRGSVIAAVSGRLGRLDRPVAALLSALLLGRREEMEGRIYEQFRSSGSLHLLALSGLHLGILYLFLSLALFFLESRRVRSLVASCLLLLYLFVAGWRPSLERGAVMFVAAAIAYALDREWRPLNILALAAAVLLLVHPHYAFDLGFQLSFLALLGVLLLAPALHRLFEPLLPPALGWPLALSLGAQLGTAPLLLSQFGVLYPVGVAAALLLIPLVTLFIGSGLIYLLFAAFAERLAAWLAAALDPLYRLLVWLLDCFSRVPALYLRWRAVYWPLFLLALLPFLFELAPRKRKASC
jgi:ComEC/Rec2-related protein